jgi:DNA polymerase-3 subunit delta
MRVAAGDLGKQLARALAPLYAIHGEEPLLVLEAADAVRAAARAGGFTQRVVFQPDRFFDWSELRHAGAGGSLFGDRTLVELRFSTGKLSAAAAEALVDWCARLNPEALLLATLPKLEGGWWKLPWFTALEAAGTVVEVPPVPRRELPAWLRARLARQEQSAGAEALDFLADRVEGNLLAAHQEVQKLALLAPRGELALDTVQDAVASVARYDADDAVEALLARDAARFLRVLEGLRGEGEAPTFVLWVISAAFFALQGGPPPFNKRLRAAVEAAQKRFSRAEVDDALAQCAAIDRAIKGVGSGDTWQRFMTLGLKLAHGSKA